MKDNGFEVENFNNLWGSIVYRIYSYTFYHMALFKW